MELTSKNVRKVLMDCLFESEEEAKKNGTPIQNIMNTLYLNMDKVHEHEDDIVSFLDQLHPTFRESVGGGWSFLKLPFKGEEEEQWGEHPNADELVALGLASGKLKFLIENRDMWKMFPGGVPYIVYCDGGNNNGDVE